MCDFAIFILTHGRPNNQKTLDTLSRLNYTGKYYLVVDNLDKTMDEYRRIYGDRVLVFNKMEVVNYTDTGLHEPLINFAVFARNAIEGLAKSMGYKYFGMFDDDILKFRYRCIDGDSIKSYDLVNMDSVITEYVSYMDKCNLACIGFGITNNYIGGLNGTLKDPSSNKLRMCFNAYLRNSSYDVDWKTNMCEDRITSVLSSVSGQVWLQLPFVQIDTAPLYGVVEGGNSSVYRSLDEFTKVFFPVVTCPSSTTTSIRNDRWYTTIRSEDNLFGRIVSGRYKK